MQRIHKTFEPAVVLGCLGVAGGRDNAHFPILIQKTDNPWDHRVVFGQVGPVVVKGDVTVESDKVKAMGADKAQQLSGIENQPDVVEGWSDKASSTDEPLSILVLEGVLQS